MLAMTDVVLAGRSTAVDVDQTDFVVSEAFEISEWEALAFAFEVTVADVSGTGGVVTLQHSFDGVNFVDVDGTNAKVTINAAGRFGLSLNAADSTVAADFPLRKYCRFVATTGGSDAFTVTKLLVQKRS